MARLAGIFLCSLSAISFEIALTRVFSISLSYHFAFMVVSIAMLGIGASGAVMSLVPSLRDLGKAGAWAILLALSIPAGYLTAGALPFDPVKLSWDRGQVLYIGAYYILLGAPFFFFGLIMASAFAGLRDRAGYVYGADLLGAGAGSVAVIAAMGAAGPGKAIFMAALLSLAGAALLGRRLAALGLAAAGAMVFILNPGFFETRISPYKGLSQALRYPGAEHLRTYHSGYSRVDAFRSPMVRFAPGLSLRYRGSLPRQIGISVDGSDINAITEAGDHGFLSYLPSALPYEMGRRDSVLVIDSRGGLPVLMARRYGASLVRAAESNPLIADVVGKDYRDFSGDVYGEGTWRGLARSGLARADERFDLMDVSLMGATPAGLFGLSEDYRFTVEAMGQYLSRLESDGVLSVSLFIIPPPRTELRLLAAALAALEERGEKSPGRHIAAIRSWGSITVVVKASPLTEGEIRAMKEFASSRGFDLVYYPGMEEGEAGVYVKVEGPDYFHAFQQIINSDTRRRFMEGYLYDVSPVRDDNPFFHSYLKPGNVLETYRLAGGKWQYFLEEGYLLPFVMAQALVLAAALLLMPALAGKRAPPGQMAYFSLLGTGFMFVEVPMIQKMILPLEHPSYAVAVVLASVLASSGAGSLLSQRVGFLRSPYVIAALALTALAYAFGLSHAARWIAPLPLPLKAALSFALAAPAGFLMGIPFPLGMRNTRPEVIPWAWAANGCFSVLSPVAAVMLATAAGFKAVLVAGAFCYALAFLAFRRSFT
ncbi:MAG: hypothetical protein Kow0025_18170 [Thermodesulfovibrionales bacterium]